MVLTEPNHTVPNCIQGTTLTFLIVNSFDTRSELGIRDKNTKDCDDSGSSSIVYSITFHFFKKMNRRNLKLFLASTFFLGVDSFSVSSHSLIEKKQHLVPVSRTCHESTRLHSAIDPSMLSSPSLLICEVESWRQYVPLVVCSGVILDILLGSPLANLALAPMKRASGMEENGDDNDENSGPKGFLSKLKPMDESGTIPRRKERIDSEAVAQAALDKARNSLELREYLERNKTDEDRMAEMRKKIDSQISKVDDELDKLEKSRQQ